MELLYVTTCGAGTRVWLYETSQQLLEYGRLESPFRADRIEIYIDFWHLAMLRERFGGQFALHYRRRYGATPPESGAARLNIAMCQLPQTH
jgi:hypothetical protein